MPSGVGCPNYAVPGGSRCEKHEAIAKRDKNQSRGGTTSEWRTARAIALRRAGHRCQACGMTDQESRDLGHGGLHVHHVGEGSFRDGDHDQAKLEVLCEPCHRAVRKKTTRPTLEEHKQQLMVAYRERRAKGLA